MKFKFEKNIFFVKTGKFTHFIYIKSKKKKKKKKKKWIKILTKNMQKWIKIFKKFLNQFLIT